MRAPGAHAFFGITADPLQRRPQASLPFRHREGAIDHAGGRTHERAHRLELGRG